MGKAISGQLWVELTSAEPELAVSAYAGAGIPMEDLQPQGALTLRFWMPRCCYPQARKLAQKRGDCLKILGKRGIYWMLPRLLRRPVLLLGAAALTGLTLFLPSRILFVQVEGNAAVPARQILEAAAQSGLAFGTSRRQVRSEKVKNALLSKIPQLQWAGVNTSGCVATVSVRERTELPPAQDPVGVSSLCAVRDGYIRSITATAGTALVQPGQTVQAGQVLISGYTDCGLCLRGEQAKGEVFAQTQQELTAVLPAKWTLRGQSLAQRRSYSLLIGKKRINLWKDSGIWEDTCGRMYEEHYITLPGGFRLPLALCIQTRTTFALTSETIPEAQAGKELTDFARRTVLKRMVAGEIQQAAEHLRQDGGCFWLEARYVCQEMIARQRQEQIGENHGENS